MSNETLDLGPDPSLLLVDDDEAFVRRLAKAMEKRGFSVETAQSVAEGKGLWRLRAAWLWGSDAGFVCPV